MKLSIIVPVYNEQDNIKPLYKQILKSIEPLNISWELILVDDGSQDKSQAVCQELAKNDPTHTSVIVLRRNFGQTAAIAAGIDHARGEVIVLLDADMQNDPADIPRLLDALKVCDVVCGYRANRRDTWSRRAASRIANAFRNAVTRDGIRDTGCSLKAFRRECAADLPPLNGMHRFMPAYFRLHGRRIEQIPVNHRARKHGRSKYTNLKRLPATLLDLFGFWWYRRRLLRA